MTRCRARRLCALAVGSSRPDALHLADVGALAGDGAFHFPDERQRNRLARLGICDYGRVDKREARILLSAVAQVVELAEPRRLS